MNARFKCIQIVENEQGRSVLLQATATDGSPENKGFFAAPAGTTAGGGQINVNLVGDATQFKPGTVYVVEFHEAK